MNANPLPDPSEKASGTSGPKSAGRPQAKGTKAGVPRIPRIPPVPPIETKEARGVEVEPPPFDAEIPDATVSKKGLTTFQAAMQLGVSPSWVKQHVDDLGGRLTRKGYRFAPDITLERVTEKVKIRASSKQANNFAKEDREGDIARKVFARFDQGANPRAIVIELGVDPDKVLQLMNKWIKCGQAEQTLAVVRGEIEPPSPSTTGAPTGAQVSPHGVPMVPITSPIPVTAPMASAMSSLGEEEPSPPKKGGLSLAESMRAQARAQIAAGDEALNTVKKRMQAETAKIDGTPGAPPAASAAE